MPKKKKTLTTADAVETTLQGDSAPTSMVAAQENRKFKMHPDLLYSVIRNQAGSIGKAVLELVMNSIDAGATRVDITLTRHNLTVKDDGKGFTKQEQIDEFFETFGTPHTAEEDSKGVVYGRFRMGRGQIFAFSSNVWRSGPFQMSVDIKTKGLDYTLDKGLPVVQGCCIDGILYDPLSPSDLIYASNQLREQCRFTPAPVFLNGDRINEDVASVKWTEETSDAYIKIEPKSTRLSIYNLGVLVNQENASVNGVAGIVVSKKALEVNFARNDVIKSKCSVWKNLKPIFAKYVSEAVGNDKKQKLTDETRDYIAQQMLAWDGEQTKAEKLLEAKIFTDVSGKHWSLYGLVNCKVKAVTVAPEVSLMADRILQQDMAIVLDGEKFALRFNRKSLEDVLKHLTRNKEWLHHYNGLARNADSLKKRLVNYTLLAASFSEEHFPIGGNELGKIETVTLGAIREANSMFVNALTSSTNLEFARRNLHAMRSDTAYAYTDGVKNIYIHEKFLRGAEFGPGRGFAWAVQVGNILVHEYIHNFNSGVGHTHDAEFYETYHSATISAAHADAERFLFGKYVEVIGKKSAQLLRDMDREAAIEDVHAKLKSKMLVVPAPLPVIEQAVTPKPKRKAKVAPVEISTPVYDRTPVPDIEIVDGFVLTAA
jgi:Histidine kinase-, DNA gyrase B-, and HSP90-like ATPase